MDGDAMGEHMQVHDFMAVGLGPFNLSLACLMAPLKECRGLFLERNDHFEWHPGMLVERCTLQNPFLADLVSLADPTSPFSYLNYCKQQGRIYSCYVRENFYLTRQDYNRYCQWAAGRLDNVRFNHEVTSIEHDERGGFYRVLGRETHTGRSVDLAARRLVLGIGSSPRLPECCPDPEMHSAHYLRHKASLQQRRAITIVGSGQSAAEIYRDLLQDIDRFGYSLTWVTRSSRFFQMENAKLVLELISPDYAEHFFHLPDAAKDRIVQDQKSVYNGINAELVDAIYDLLDERRQELRGRTRLLPNMELRSCRAEGGGHTLEFMHTELGRRYRHHADGLVFATGYQPAVPAFVDGIRHRIAWDAQGRYRQHRNYAVDLQGDEIFVQNAGCHSHGVTNPDLGLACHRNAHIVRGLTGVEAYPIETRTTLQDFAPRDDGAFVEVAA
jgi:lysine N6-hydroxylase